MKTFRSRLVLLGGAVAIFAVLLTTSFQTWHARMELIQATEVQGEEIGRLLGQGAQATILAETGGPQFSVHDLLDNLLSGERVQAAWIMDGSGKVIAVGHGTVDSAELTELDRAKIAEVDGGTLSYFTDTALTIVTPTTAPADGPHWTVLLRVDRSDLDASLWSEIGIGLGVLFVAAFIAFLVMSRVAGWLSAPLAAVSADATVSAPIAAPVTAPALQPAAPSAATLVVTAANRMDELGRLAAEIERFAEDNELPPRAAMHLDMSVEEIVSNVIKYGFEAGDIREDAIELSLSLTGDRLSIRIADTGGAFDPLADAPVPDIDAAVEDRPIGGLGVHIVKTVMVELRYTRDGDRNVLDMVLELSAPAA